MSLSHLNQVKYLKLCELLKNLCHPHVTLYVTHSLRADIWCMDIRKKQRPKPWMAKKKSRAVWSLTTGEKIVPFSGNYHDSSFYHTPEWRATSKAVLNRDAICRWCFETGTLTVATQADHVIPIHRLIDIHPLDQDNIVASCASCNARRAALDARGVIFYSFEEWVKYLRTRHDLLSK